jgi:hypothetical protein
VLFELGLVSVAESGVGSGEQGPGVRQLQRKVDLGPDPPGAKAPASRGGSASFSIPAQAMKRGLRSEGLNLVAHRGAGRNRTDEWRFCSSNRGFASVCVLSKATIRRPVRTVCLYVDSRPFAPLSRPAFPRPSHGDQLLLRALPAVIRQRNLTSVQHSLHERVVRGLVSAPWFS